MRRRSLRIFGTLGLTGACIAYLASKIEIAQTLHVLADARLEPLCGALAIVLVANIPLAWRWQQLLRARGITEHLPWLVRAYFVGHAVAQVLPTGVGGDAMRIVETAQRHPGARGRAAASVLVERVLGGAATLALGGFALAIGYGRYGIGAYIWLEAALVGATIALAATLVSHRARRRLASWSRLLRRLHVERPLRAVYDGIHGYRAHLRLLAGGLLLTILVQASRVLSIWLLSRAVGVNLSPLPFYVLGPLLLLIGLVPFTVNGLAIRESFFVGFLGGLGVSPENALAIGFLYFLLSLGLAVPGATILLWESLRLVVRPAAERA